MNTKLATLLLILTVLLAPYHVKAEELGAVRLSLVEGDVRVYDHDSEAWFSATVNQPIADGDIVTVRENGRAEMHISGGIFIRLDRSTSLELVSHDSRDAHLYLEQGQIYINNAKGGREIIQIDTPAATCTTADNSISMIDVIDRETTDLALLKGYAFLESNLGKTKVTSGNSYRTSQHGAEVAPLSTPDEWERWNRDRDYELQRLGESIRYLPEELHEYSNDFDRNGSWLFDRTYGYIWSPSVVESGWVPFRAGRWVWIRNDYVWVSGDRWGWAPHHYGRWTHISGRGWCWVPPRPGSVVWGPGFVAWVQTPVSIAWVPLAPGEIYYGRRNYGTGTAVIDKHYAAPQRPVYRNVSVNNSVTVIPTNSFNSRERYRHIIKNDNPFKQQLHQVSPPPPPVVRSKPRIDSPTAQNRPFTDNEKRPTVRPKIQERISIPAASVPSSPKQSPAASDRTVVPHPRQTKTTAPTPSVQHQQQRQPAAVKPAAPVEYRGPRTFVRKSDESAFKKEPPKQLPVKTLDEPQKTPKKAAETIRKDLGSDSRKGESHSQPRGNPKGRFDKP